MNDNETVEKAAQNVEKPVSKMSKTGKFLGKVLAVVSSSPKLRGLLAGGMTTAFAAVGIKHIDPDTALAMIGAATLLAGWGPTQTPEA